MPNTARGGGISRKITNAQDRKRLKDMAQDLEVPEGMGVILRTAGANRTKTEVKRDFEYLLRMWETVRDLTLKSTAPKLTYEEGSLVKRSIRDLYNKEIDEILVAGDEATGGQGLIACSCRACQEREALQGHAAGVLALRHREPARRHFHAGDAVALGRHIVLNQTEALVSIDVKSGARRANITSRTPRSRPIWRRRRRSRASSACATSPG